MKELSIPNLRYLQNSNDSGVELLELQEDILEALTIPVSNMWTDTTTVLHWLNSDSKQTTFVANRIGEIVGSMKVEGWFHVLSGDNPDETGTRRISAEP